MKKYVTKGGEMLDEICFAHYGDDQQIDRVLRANPEIASLSFKLPAGVKISLPDEVKQEEKAVTLW